MYNFTEFLKDLSQSSNIPFNVVTEDGTALYISDLDIESSHITKFTIMLGRVKGIISLEKQYENCTSLLKYTIENKYTQNFLTKEQSVIDILENREISIDNINVNLPFLKDGCFILLISVDGSKYESLNVIKQIYDNEPVISLIYNDSIIVIGDFDETEEHAESIKESISSDLYCKCYVSYGERTYDARGIKKAYKDATNVWSLEKNLIKKIIFLIIIKCYLRKLYIM